MFKLGRCEWSDGGFAEYCLLVPCWFRGVQPFFTRWNPEAVLSGWISLAMMLWWPPNDGRQCVMILKKQQETAVIFVLLVVKSMIMMELLILPWVNLSFNVSKDIDFEWFWYIEGHLERRLQPSRDLHPSRPPTRCGNFGGLAVCWHLICWMLHFPLCFPFFNIVPW